ncbi:MAG: alpha/beta hydrolase fold domain-containing protein [Methanomassiliicoccales archaeon]|nr:MAG: alpha/beta hydrolase fold domain-containing protein [Methanomassiliicoccales archaeon]
MKYAMERIIHNTLFSLCQTLFLLLFISFLTTSSALAMSGPSQPSEGPGGTDYFHSKVISNCYGSGALQYYLFEPDAPKPSTAPLVVFIHGFGGVRPSTYDSWIEHIVKKGNIVVFPVYQSIASSFSNFTSNTLKAVLDAINKLQEENHVRPELDNFATVGHSVGGILSANIAALAQKSGLPTVRAIMSVQPGKSPLPKIEDLSKIPSDTLLLAVVGDRDTIAGDKDAKKIFYAAQQIPPENKDFVTMVSDQYDFFSSLTADHFAPCCTSSGGLGSGSDADALDYYCLWKLFDALTDAAFYNENREYALGNTPQQRYMGEWSDGRPVKELTVNDNP